MAEITTTQAFSDGDTVTATKLNNITANASIGLEAITNRSAETTTDQANDLLLMYDASATALKKVTLSNVIKAGTASNFPVSGSIELGHASDTTLSRGSAGRLQVEGVDVVTATSTDTLTNKTLTSPAISGGTINNASVGATTPSTGAFTTLSATGDVSIADKIVHSGDTNTAIRFPAADTVTIETSGSEHVRVGSSGNVGIGTSSPKGRLEVSSTFLSGETGAQCIFPLNVTIGNGGSSYGSIGYNLDYRSATNNTTGVKYLSNDEISQLDFYAGGFIFRNAPSGTGGSTATLTERLRIDSSGNVGIGTTSPAQKLHILGIKTDTGSLGYNALIDEDRAAAADRGAGVAFGLRGAVLGGVEMGCNASATTDAYMTFNTVAGGTVAERLRITSTGAISFGSTGTAYGTSGQVLTSAGNNTPTWTTATNANTASAIVQRDASGNFSAGTITAALTGNSSTATTLQNARTIAISGDVSGTATSFNGSANISIPATISSLADSKLATISTANKVSLAALDIDGATDIGAALADADLIPVDDGGLGTNRKSAVSRIPTYVFGKVSGDATINSSGVLSLVSGSVDSTALASGSITYGKLSTSATEADNVAKRTAKAWVNFNGTGTPAIRGDFNVSSITDNGTGDYTLNFSAALSNGNYCIAFGTIAASTSNISSGMVIQGTSSTSATSKTSSGVRVATGSSASGGLIDHVENNAIIFD